MENFIEARGNMTEAEWQMYEQHLAKRAAEEQKKIEIQRERNRIIRAAEIERILKTCGERFTRQQLEKKSTNVLMMIY